MVAECLCGLTRHGAGRPDRKKEKPVKKMITAAIGSALLSGSLLAAGDADADVYYKNCSEARTAGVTPLYEGDPGYAPHSTGTTTASPASSRTGAIA